MDDTNRMAHRIVTIPNLLSLFRLLLIPCMLYCYLQLHQPLWTMGLLVLSGLTDVIDGRIARRFRMISNLGKILDPIADKLTQVAMIACLVWLHPQLILVLSVQVVRELTLGITGLVVMKRTRLVSGADWHGKACTVLLYLSVLLLFLMPGLASWAVWLLSGLCTGAIVLSFVLYMRSFCTVLQQQKQQQVSTRKNCAS